MPTEIIDPIVYPGWDTLIGSMPEQSFFYSSNWANVLKETYSYRPLYFTRSEGPEKAKPVVVIPVMEVDSFLTGKRGVSIPFTDYCEPIAPDEDSFSSMFDEVLQYGRKAGWKYLELRGRAQHFNGAAPYRTYLRHVLKIHGDDAKLFQQASAATRRNIRKAAASDVRITISDSGGDLERYYELHCLTRKRQGVPPQPRRFFMAIHRNVISKSRGFTVLASHQGRVIAGAVFFYAGKKGIYKYGASDLRHQNLRGNNLVIWEAIRWFSRNGFDELCLGRTDVENVGLARFKKGWGSHESEILYYRLDPLSGKLLERSGYKPPYGLMRKIPFVVSRIAGSLLYRHIG
jgi:hypothetical protein